MTGCDTTEVEPQQGHRLFFTAECKYRALPHCSFFNKSDRNLILWVVCIGVDCESSVLERITAAVASCVLSCLRPSKPNTLNIILNPTAVDTAPAAAKHDWAAQKYEDLLLWICSIGDAPLALWWTTAVTCVESLIVKCSNGRKIAAAIIALRGGRQILSRQNVQ